MRQEYKKPELTIHKFETNDVIATSCTNLLCNCLPECECNGGELYTHQSTSYGVAYRSNHNGGEPVYNKKAEETKESHDA